MLRELHSDPLMAVEALLLSLFLGWFFYRTLWMAALIFPLTVPVCRQHSGERKRKKQDELVLEFREALGSMITAMKAGFSADNAIRETYKEMVSLYGSGSLICREFYLICQGLDSHVPLEQLMLDFGERSGCDDIREFAGVFTIARRSGGNMAEIMEHTVSLLQDRISVENEISVLISAKRMEQKIMNIVPFLIVLYIGATSRGFFGSLYHNTRGAAVMTVCLLLYTVAFRWSEKIMDIQV